MPSASLHYFNRKVFFYKANQMRDIALTLVIVSLALYAIKHSHIGILLWNWISLMSPHRLSWGFAYSLPFAALVAGVTLVSLFFSKQARRPPLPPVIIVLILFILWFNVTSVFALEPDAVFQEWDRAMKIQLMVFVALLVMQTRERINQLVWVVALSIGFFGIKGGIFGIATGGSYRVFGPADSFIADNNALALAIVMIIPLMRYLHLQAENVWVKRALLAAMILCAVSVIASYSRGALLAIAAMVLVLWWKGRAKILTGITMLVVGMALLFFMPEQWFARMDTIGTYQTDASAMGRINAWTFAYNLASDRFFGGGFNAFSERLFYQYAPNPTDVHDAHSIYFEVLGEQVFVGLLLFLTLLFLAFRTARSVIQLAKPYPEFKWAGDLAAMVQVSLVGYCVGGTFLGLAYYDLPYTLIAILVLTQTVLSHELQQNSKTSARSAKGLSKR